MGTVAKTISGARATVAVNGTIVGIFNNISVTLTYDVQPIFILGRYSPNELVYTAQEPVSLSATGWKVFGIPAGAGSVTEGGQGPAVPPLQELLFHQDISIAIFDRANPGTAFCTVTGVRPTGWRTTVSARGAEELTVDMLGLLVSDELKTSGETSSATSF